MSIWLLEEYIQTGNSEELANLLTANPELATTTTSLQVSPLMLSCYYKKPEISKILLRFTGEPDIFEAAAVGKFDTIASLAYNHPELINTFSVDGFTPLGLACFFEHEEVARYLLLKGADVNIPSSNGFNVYPLHSAVASNNADITKILLEAGAEVNVKQGGGVTPLHSAAQHGNIEILILLLEAGASIEAKMEDGRLPFELALEKGFHDIARILSE
ncbi:ankyrin repeat domain-containing protein [Rubrolithibacter danxiaensis]|uniref:ankyrin repeat domain-containing protein n=1 Tax=Rubrolithibacter danxiaensis TaxID=3390805 RepID=UPI003BF80C22